MWHPLARQVDPFSLVCAHANLRMQTQDSKPHSISQLAATGGSPSRQSFGWTLFLNMYMQYHYYYYYYYDDYYCFLLLLNRRLLLKLRTGTTRDCPKPRLIQFSHRLQLLLDSRGDQGLDSHTRREVPGDRSETRPHSCVRKSHKHPQETQVHIMSEPKTSSLLGETKDWGCKTGAKLRVSERTKSSSCKRYAYYAHGCRLVTASSPKIASDLKAHSSGVETLTLSKTKSNCWGFAMYSPPPQARSMLRVLPAWKPGESPSDPGRKYSSSFPDPYAMHLRRTAEFSWLPNFHHVRISWTPSLVRALKPNPRNTKPPQTLLPGVPPKP